jgi:NhaA family Na+:H+ antiporter
MAAAGVEPALAGVVVGVLIPSGVALTKPGVAPATPGVDRVRLGVDPATRDPAERLESRLGPLSAYVVLPLFALANAGVTIESNMLAHPGATGVFVGIVLARLFGKMAGITLASLLVIWLGVGRLPTGVTRGHLAGAAAVAGIGFTVPLLFAEQAFLGRPTLVAASQAGLLAGSVSAFVVGAVVLIVVDRRRGGGQSRGSYAGDAGPPSGGGLAPTRATNEETP